MLIVKLFPKLSTITEQIEDFHGTLVVGKQWYTSVHPFTKEAVSKTENKRSAKHFCMLYTK